jgi:site-specific recombinase XerD
MEQITVVNNRGVELSLDVLNPSDGFYEVFVTGTKDRLVWGSKEHVESVLRFLEERSVINNLRRRGFTVIEV